MHSVECKVFSKRFFFLKEAVASFAHLFDELFNTVDVLSVSPQVLFLTSLSFCLFTISNVITAIDIFWSLAFLWRVIYNVDKG